MKSHILALLPILVVATACAHANGDAGAWTPSGRPLAPRVETRQTADALALLRTWDHQRSQAWRRGDPEALAGLYTRGSRTGRRDRAMLAAYDTRDLRVFGLRTQVLAASVRSWAPREVTLEVVDREVGARAVGGGVRTPLPRDRPSTRVISLRRVAGAWRVAEVRPARQPARP